MQERFTHENLDVYRCAIDFLSVCSELLQALPAGNAELASQLRRAALSIPLNIAEGTGRQGSADKKRYFLIARGSALECAALLDAIAALPFSARYYYESFQCFRRWSGERKRSRARSRARKIYPTNVMLPPSAKVLSQKERSEAAGPARLAPFKPLRCTSDGFGRSAGR